MNLFVNSIIINNKIVALITFDNLFNHSDFKVEIPQEQRLRDEDKITEIVKYQMDYYQKHQHFNFIGSLIFNKIQDKEVYYLTDGQHRYFAMKELFNKKYQAQIFIEILLINNLENFKENYCIINKNTPLPEFPENIDKQIVESVALHFFKKYFTLFKTNRANRPNLNKNHFQSSVAFLLEKLPDKSSNDLIKLIEDKNTKIRNWRNYGHLKISENMLNLAEENKFYLGLFVYKEDNAGGYQWIRDLVQENSGKMIKTRMRKTRISKQIKDQVWEEYMGNVREALCYCCRNNKIKNTSYHCGHVLSEADGGELELENLRPICGECNAKMSTTNMREYIENEYPKNLTLFNNKIKPLIKENRIYIKTMDL